MSRIPGHDQMLSMWLLRLAEAYREELWEQSCVHLPHKFRNIREHLTEFHTSVSRKAKAKRADY